VLAATRDIPKGAVIEEGMLETKSMPKEYIEPQAVSYPERIVGMVTAVPMTKGEQITLTKLVSAKQATSSSLAMATPVGKRAVSISVDNISSLMGMIKAGDYVDVIGFIPVPAQTPEGKQTTQMAVMPLFQNILVLAVGKDLGGRSQEVGRYAKEEGTASAPPLITLAFTPQEANLITFVSEQGKVRLVLRSPADSRIEPIQPASWETLFQYLMPQLPQQVQAEKGKETELVQKPKPREIEIYRGLKREKIAISEEQSQ
jgi:pilus assembly protein CpaB